MDNDKNINNLEIEIVKEISSGGNGTAYLVYRGKEKLVYKVEKMDIFDEPLQSEYYRQIKFDKDIAKHHPDKFLVLKSHGIINDCEYKHPNTDHFISIKDEHRKQRFIRKNSQPNCYFLLYSPLLEGTFIQVKDKIYNNSSLFIDFMYQIIGSINIIRKKGYSQNDFNPGNIMYKKKDGGYQWYIIDYGNMCNKKFPLSALDKDIRDRPLYCMDLVMFVRGYSAFYLRNYIFEHKIKRPPFDKYMECIKKEPEYDNIIKHVPSSIKKENTFNMFVNMINRILYPKVYLKCIGTPKEVYEDYKHVNEYQEIFMYCLKHHDDETYDHILEKIKKIEI